MVSESPSGGNRLFLPPVKNTILYQDFRVRRGQTYYWCLEHAARGEQEETLRFDIGDEVHESFAATAWQQREGIYFATTDVVRLKLSPLVATADTAGSVIDGVQFLSTRELETYRDEPYVFAKDDFFFGDRLHEVELVSVPVYGKLTLKEEPVAAGTIIGGDELANGQLAFTPDAGSGRPGDLFQFKARPEDIEFADFRGEPFWMKITLHEPLPEVAATAEETPPPEPRRAPPVPSNAFQDLPTEFDILPGLSQFKTQDIGKVHVAPGAPLVVELLGGDLAYRVHVAPPQEEEKQDTKKPQVAFEDLASGRQPSAARSKPRGEVHGIKTFRLKEIVGTDAIRWHVELVDYGGEIAQLWIENGMLKFRWSHDAITLEPSGYLANCLLLLRDQFANEHVIRLRPIQKVPVVPVQLKSGNAFASYPISFPPPAETMFVEIVSSANGLPEGRVENRHLLLPNDSTQVTLHQAASVRIGLQVVMDGDDEFRIVTKPYFKLPNMQQQIPLQTSRLSAAKKAAEDSLRLVTANRKAVAAVRAKTKAAGPRRALDKQLREMSRVIRKKASDLNIVKSVEAFRNKYGNKGGVHYRLYRILDGHDVTLLWTGKKS